MTAAIKTVIAAVGLLGATLVSCSHKDIACPGAEVRDIDVVFDWAKAPEADPEGMTLIFFPLGIHEQVWRFDIAGPGGGGVKIPTGTYRMIAFNNDDHSVRITDTQSFDAMTASARNRDKDMFGTTGMLYRAEVEHLEVTPCGVNYMTGDGSCKECPKNIVRACPDSACTVYDIRVSDIKGIGGVKKAYAALSGTASSLRLGPMISETHGDRLYAPMEISASDRLMTASANAFTPTDPGKPSTLTIAVTRTDGKSFSKSFDLTGEMMNPISPRHVFIEIKGLEIPEGDTPGSDVGDIDVIVDGWTTIEIDLGYNV